MNKPASLTAGVCSLYITATMVAVPPQAAAAELPVVQHRSVSVLDQPYQLTATSQALQNLLLVAGIPFNNLNTTLTTLGGLTNFVTGLNLALGNIYKGNWDLVPANIQKAWTDEVAAFQKVLQLPQTLIAYNTKTIQNFVNSLAAGGSTLAVRSAASTAVALPTAQSDVTNALLVVLGIPFNNLNTTLTTLGGLTNFVTGLNQALGNIYRGNWNLVPANLQKAWADEVAAFQKVLQLPQTLINYNIKALQNLVGSLAPAALAPNIVTSERVYTLALPAAASSIEGGKPGTAVEPTGTEVKDAVEGTDAPKGVGVEDGTETIGEVDTTVPEETSGPEETTGPEDAADADETVTDDTDAVSDDASEPSTDTEKPSEKPADTDNSDDADPVSGEHSLDDDDDKGAPYGKHARQDDVSGSASSGPGRHRKAENASGASSSTSSPSTGGSSAAA